MLNVAFSELKMKKGKVVLTNRGSIFHFNCKDTFFVFCFASAYKEPHRNKKIIKNISLIFILYCA